MKVIITTMIATIIDAEEKNVNYFVIEDMRSNLKRLLNQFAITSNCPSNWRYLKEELQEEYKDNEFILDIIGGK